METDMATIKSLFEVQKTFNSQFPNSDITIVEYNGANREGVVHHPDYGDLKFSSYRNLSKFPDSKSLLHSLSNNKLNSPKRHAVSSPATETMLNESDSAILNQLIARIVALETRESQYQQLIVEFIGLANTPVEQITQAFLAERSAYFQAQVEKLRLRD